ncbi:MAG: gamma-glutamyltransferase, partial [Candidatus Marinimicrobia bacterium]|nr:gamma-glutamyltransferase [Candidatus Neomarinimicrobiota bacterium]
MKALTLLTVILLALPLPVAAGDAPRIVHSGSSQPTGSRMSDGGTVYLESGIPEQTVQALIKMGHRVSDEPGFFGGYQAIMWDGEHKV